MMKLDIEAPKPTREMWTFQISNCSGSHYLQLSLPYETEKEASNAADNYIGGIAGRPQKILIEVTW